MGLACPACTAEGLEFDGEATFECSYCATQLVAERTQCPACSELNVKGADFCSNCGEPLSIVASVLDRQGGLGEPLWIRRLRGQVSALKEREAYASEQRFEKLVEVDRRRKQIEREAYVQQQEADRSILFYGAAAVLLIILSILIVAVVF